ncbi:hypothetical protein EV196_1097 [Mariniflexile fucanivorans]|uniref:Uncharacterized protein n=1 Tax=Mariniflexile fucanivorans TaxID=264023 RepID=A0A4R1RC48_9FLAO|nr:hypothetical protein EV196_1097 [Mariniflexile fucanivorans]
MNFKRGVYLEQKSKLQTKVVILNEEIGKYSSWHINR